MINKMLTQGNCGLRKNDLVGNSFTDYSWFRHLTELNLEDGEESPFM